MHQPPNWYDHNADNSPWIKALTEVRHLACREGWCYHHVQAIIVSIDQSGFDIRTFECPACDHNHQCVIELVDPMKSFETADWLRGELRAPA
jgi:hypothetical protein